MQYDDHVLTQGDKPISEGELLIEDLRLDLHEIVRSIREVVESRDELDLYLLTAGLSQLLRDYLENDPVGILRSVAYAKTLLPTSIGNWVVRTGRKVSLWLRAAQLLGSPRKKLERDLRGIEDAVTAFADGVTANQWPSTAAEDLMAILDNWDARGQKMPGTCLRLPSCFRSFDQHPRDMRTLAGMVREATLVSEIEAPSVVIGIRSSGSYLAPLLAASLSHGMSRPQQWMTIRPGRPLLDRERGIVSGVIRGGGLVFIVDDPPGSGATLEKTVQHLESMGFRRDQLCLTLATMPDSKIPASLADCPRVLLEWSNWDIHQRLNVTSITEMFNSRSWFSSEAMEAEMVETATDGSSRGHAWVRCRVHIGGDSVDQFVTHELVIEGSGLGYFGRHSIAVANLLSTFVPKVYGFYDGVVVSEWIPEDSKIEIEDELQLGLTIDYVVRRRSTLATPRDSSISMAGQHPVWEVASNILSKPYPKLGNLMKFFALDSAVRKMLTVGQASVIDGMTGAGSWCQVDGSILKLNFALRDFSNLDLAAYDAVYDLAGIVVCASNLRLESLARRDFEVSTGESVDPERWLIYQLVHVWNFERQGILRPYEAEYFQSRAWQAWAKRRLVGSALEGGSGRVCALDIDGVLESSRFGASTLTPSSARGLRALQAHGYRPVLVSGRSLRELRDRCFNFGLVGGVAEYGGVAYLRDSDELRFLADDRSASALQIVKVLLSSKDEVILAEGFATMIRAYRVNASGSRTSLPKDVVAAVLDATDGEIVAIYGIAQTDFVSSGVSKSLGVKLLMEMLGRRDESLAFAVGDSEADLSMIELAEMGYLLAHAKMYARRNMAVSRSSYQRGFAEAVEVFIGHSPGECAACSEHLDIPIAARLLAALQSDQGESRIHAVVTSAQIFRAANRAR